MCLALLEAAVVVMNTETWSLPVSLSSFYFSSAPSSHSSKSYYPTFLSYKIKVLVDIDKWKRSWRKWYWREKKSLWGSVGTSAQPGKMPWTSEDPSYLNCWDSVIVNVLVNVNSIYLIVLVCGRKEGVWKDSLILQWIFQSYIFCAFAKYSRFVIRYASTSHTDSLI